LSIIAAVISTANSIVSMASQWFGFPSAGRSIDW